MVFEPFHFTGNFEKEIPESDSGTGNDYFGFADNKKKKKFNALSVDGRVLCYGGWTKEGKKYMGCGNFAHGHRRRVRGIFFFCFPS
jgi:hypothetical protein